MKKIKNDLCPRGCAEHNFWNESPQDETGRKCLGSIFRPTIRFAPLSLMRAQDSSCPWAR